jgi:signal transduction histidine kinase
MSSEQPQQPRGRILIIDDERVLLDLTAIVLRNRGYQVFTASSAAEGLATIEKEQPELVLLDYMMPSTDGMTALKDIRRIHPECYVIMCTGKGSESVAVELMKAGASDYVLKPFNNQDLAERIEHVLKLRRVELENKLLVAERERLTAEIAGWNQDLEARVLEKTEALKRAQAEIVQSEKLVALGYLSAGMAHSIRNPLNSIALFVQLIKSGLDEEERLEYVDKILVEVDRIDGILGQLLHAAKRPKFQLSEVRVDEVLEHTLEAFGPQVQQKRIRVVSEVYKVPPAIKADPIEIEQILTNLFLNSLDVMSDEGTLGVQLDCDEKYISLRVSDTGPGIAPEHIRYIFDPFFSTNSRGTGLGLSVVLRIVKNYKGKIEVEKSDAGGTVFAVRLPVLQG